jgi:hypothetical protein
MKKMILALLAALVVAFINLNPSVAKAEDEICDDSNDNDNDGNIDCADTDCNGKPGPNGQDCTAGPPQAAADDDDSAADDDDTNPAAAADSVATAATSAPAAAPCEQSCDPKKVALAERWHLKLSATTDTPACELTCSTTDGQSCWSKAFEEGKAWDWADAPRRWSVTLGDYVSKGVWDAVNRAADTVSRLAETEQKLTAAEQTIEDMKSKIDGDSTDKGVVARIGDLESSASELRTALSVFKRAPDSSFPTLQGQVEDFVLLVQGFKGRLDLAEERLDKIEPRLTVLEERPELIIAGSQRFYLEAGSLTKYESDGETYQARGGTLGVGIGLLVGGKRNSAVFGTDMEVVAGYNMGGMVRGRFAFIGLLEPTRIFRLGFDAGMSVELGGIGGSESASYNAIGFETAVILGLQGGDFAMPFVRLGFTLKGVGTDGDRLDESPSPGFGVGFGGNFGLLPKLMPKKSSSSAPPPDADKDGGEDSG